MTGYDADWERDADGIWWPLIRSRMITPDIFPLEMGTVPEGREP